MNIREDNTALLIHVRGLVQGVGFRPFIYRLAFRHGIKGWVENRNDGVKIHAEAPEGALQDFIRAIAAEAPDAANIRSVNVSAASLLGTVEFKISRSEDVSGEITDISPDIAVCDKCLADLKTQRHRIDYPFINCTNCGPRFTIISDLPYDRRKTTMDVFPMCDVCRDEYEDIMDRRFHAQPVACNNCGPRYTMVVDGMTHSSIRDILRETSLQIIQGRILAMKGLGGFHLACDGLNNHAAEILRKRKNRDGKPFAVMFRDVSAVEEYLEVNDTERKALLSWHRPIVILKNRPGSARLAPAVSNGFHTTGAMLPYMPFHYLLFEYLQTPVIVLTSGNVSDEPIVIDNQQAIRELKTVADSFVTYDREILNRTDDSVMMVIGDEERMIRRSRGYVPTPVQLHLRTEGIFAAGAELVNCFCIGKGRQALMSQHIGDLKNLETLEFYEEAIGRFKKMFRFEPELFAMDMHPDYLSSKYCLNCADAIEAVQHHHAHIASCMAEHGLDEEVIGVSLDGVGYGTDGNIWGFELMTCDLADFKRILHPRYTPQPGGDMATKEPWRMAVSYLHRACGHRTEWLSLPFLEKIDPDKIDIVIRSIEKGINAPLTCSAGRLFDAVAALTGTCIYSDFHAEAPMRLEQVAAPGITEHYDFDITVIIDVDPVIGAITRDIRNDVSPSVISSRFHNTVLEMITRGCSQIRRETGIRKVVLSGGTFQNRYLLSRVGGYLEKAGFKHYTHRVIPSNDGGIALGQLAVAAKRRSLA